jgi:hypothetical protein
MEGAPLLGTPKAAYSNVPKRLPVTEGQSMRTAGVRLPVGWGSCKPEVKSGIEKLLFLLLC